MSKDCLEERVILKESKNKGPNLLENEAYILNYLKGGILS